MDQVSAPAGTEVSAQAVFDRMQEIHGRDIAQKNTQIAQLGAAFDALSAEVANLRAELAWLRQDDNKGLTSA